MIYSDLKKMKTFWRFSKTGILWYSDGKGNYTHSIYSTIWAPLDLVHQQADKPIIIEKCINLRHFNKISKIL